MDYSCITPRSSDIKGVVMSNSNPVYIGFRIDRSLHTKLNGIADEQRRSMQQQIITILEAAVREWDEQQQPQRRRREAQPA